MSEQAIYTEVCPAPPVQRDEILRYMGCREASDAVKDMMEDCIREALPLFVYRVVWRELPLCETEDGLCLGSLHIRSRSLKTRLQGCHSALLFAATVGIGIDRAIARYSRISPAKALCLQAFGSERAEALCDAFCEKRQEEYRANGLLLRPRFSPGYGDLPLELQRDVFERLDCSRKIGLSLKESLLMSPSKSVTAIVGIGKDNV